MASISTVSPVAAELAAELAFAHQLADLADSISLPAFRATHHTVRTKPDHTPVTEADVAVETALRARIAEQRPNDAVLGEEGGGAATAGGRRWIIDPIDGTKNFMSGIPLYGTLIALEVDGQIQVAVVSAPALQTRWWAARGQGAYRRSAIDGVRRLHVNGVTRIEDGVLAWSGVGGVRHAAERRFHRLRVKFFLNRKVGNTWAHMLVAEGAAAVATGGHVSQWDTAAPSLIVEEAGGRMTDWNGEATSHSRTALSTNGVLHDQMVHALSSSWLQRHRPGHSAVPAAPRPEAALA